MAVRDTHKPGDHSGVAAQEGITISNALVIPAAEVWFKFSRSGGRGGQHVNKVSSRVELRFSVRDSSALSDVQKVRLTHTLRGRIDSEGILHLTADSSRSQWSNREDATARFVDLLREGLRPPKKRVATRPTRAAKRKRSDAKRHRSDIKSMRRQHDVQE